jgi:predicted amidohydrolase YtcJ
VRKKHGPLRWDSVASVADAMFMLKREVAVTPPPQWARAVALPRISLERSAANHR